MNSAIRTWSHTDPLHEGQRSARALSLASAAALILLLAVLFNIQPPATTFRIGQVAGTTVVAQGKVSFVDHAATVARRNQAMRSVKPQTEYTTVQAQSRRLEAADFLAKAEPMLVNKGATPTTMPAVRSLLPVTVSSAPFNQFPALTAQGYAFVRQQSLALLSQAIALKFGKADRESIEVALLSTVPHPTPEQRAAIGDVLSAFLTPTIGINQQATQALQRAAAQRVAPVVTTLFPGEVIVRRGDLVTSTVIEELAALGLQSHRAGPRDIVASLLFALLIVTLLYWYLHATQATIVERPRLMLLLTLSILGTVAFARLFTAGHVVLPFFLPIASVSIFCAVLMAPDACIAITLAIALLAGWVVGGSFELTVYYFVTGAAGVLAIRQMRRLTQFIVAGLYVTVFGLATTLAFGLIDHSYDLVAFEQHVAAAAFNGLISSALALGAWALLSEFFGVTTVLRLLELGQPDQPLLRRLAVRAPGTHNHSLIVATMVERAAEDAGANSLVAKVGALYHDVGKSLNPYSFVENQMGITNIHDELEAEESARIIRGHVTQGLRLAHQYRVPRVILDAIAEHHGTMTVGFFLAKARQETGNYYLDESLYTYPGPKPQSKETALLMLADGCESAVRASADRSPTRIRQIVERIFQERVDSDQLSESPLTLRDMDRAREAFCAVLNGLYHPRIEYPDAVEPITDLPMPAAGETALNEPA